MALRASTGKATTKSRKSKAAAAGIPMPPEPDAIAVRAYEIYEAAEGGDSLEHWLQAERELAASATVA
jgi:hypothetical protein